MSCIPAITQPIGEDFKFKKKKKKVKEVTKKCKIKSKRF